MISAATITQYLLKWFRKLIYKFYKSVLFIIYYKLVAQTDFQNRPFWVKEKNAYIHRIIEYGGNENSGKLVHKNEVKIQKNLCVKMYM